MLRRGIGRIQAVDGHREDKDWGGAQGGYRLSRGTGRIQGGEGHREDTGWQGAQGTTVSKL